MEGQFYRKSKTTRHPHTNMAKAALNMMTRTSAADFQADGIHLNSVDTGWITDEDPAHVSERKTAENGFHPPLDIVDGAARIVDPIFDGINTGRHVWGQFLKTTGQRTGDGGLSANHVVVPVLIGHQGVGLEPTGGVCGKHQARYLASPNRCPCDARRHRSRLGSGLGRPPPVRPFRSTSAGSTPGDQPVFQPAGVQWQERSNVRFART
jgi:hypothetical protein